MAAALLVVVAGCGSSNDSKSSVTLPPLGNQSGATTRAGATTVAGSGSATTAASGSASATTVAAAKGAIDPCKLVTKAEAETLAKTTLQAGVLVEGEDPSCTYSGAPTGPTAQVEIFAGAGAKKYYDVDVTLGHEFTKVSGIGDEAHLEEFTIFTRKGATWLAIHLVRLDDPDPYNEPLKTAAKTALTRM